MSNSLIYFNRALNMLMTKWLYRMSILYDDFPFDSPKQFKHLISKEAKIRQRVRGACAIDRTNEYRFQFNAVGSPMLPFKYEDEGVGSLEDLMTERCMRLCKTGKKIQFFWSGGIDSTAALCLLDQICPEQIMVQLTPSSIEENPNFYKNRVQSLDNNIYAGDNLYSVADPEKYVVVECGAADALYGSMGEDHVKGDLTRVWRMRNRFGRSSRRFRFLQDYPGDKINLDNIWPFYESRGIEQWFINSIIEGSIKPFNRDDDKGYLKQKLALRSIIARHTGDKEFAETKVGVWSIRANEQKIVNLRKWGDQYRQFAEPVKGDDPPSWVTSSKSVWKVLGIREDGSVININNFAKTLLIPLLNLDAMPEIAEYSQNRGHTASGQDIIRSQGTAIQ